MNSSLVYLVQTDTTVGFSSSDDEKLSEIKQRPKTQKILQTIDTHKTLNSFTRVAKKYRKRVRNSKNTTFIYPNLKSFRKIETTSSYRFFVNKFKNIYSTSANLTGHEYDKDFAISKADIIVYDKYGFSTSNASTILRVSKNRLKKLR